MLTDPRTRALVLVLVWSVHVVNEAVIHVSSTPDSQGRLYFIRKLGRTRKLETHGLRQHIGGRMVLMLIRRLLMRRPRPIRERRWALLLGVVVVHGSRETCVSGSVCVHVEPNR